jgi:hypothetical protein
MDGGCYFCGGSKVNAKYNMKDCKLALHLLIIFKSGKGQRETWKFHLVYFQKVIVCTGRPYGTVYE